MAELIEVKVGDILPNPFRDLEHYPLDENKVSLLKASFLRTGFWEGYLHARRAKGGKVEQAFGHHRIAAARELGIKTIRIMVGDYDDDMMIRMMAHENSEHFRTMFYWSVMEPIEQVVYSYAEGRIELERPVFSGRVTTVGRIAPSFVDTPATRERGERVRGEKEGDERAYTAGTVGKYLGWVKPSRPDEASDRVLTALSALELIERKVLTRETFYNIGCTAAASIVKETKERLKIRTNELEKTAEVIRERAAAARESGDESKAKQLEKKAKNTETRVSKVVSDLRQRAEHVAKDLADKTKKTLTTEVIERHYPHEGGMPPQEENKPSVVNQLLGSVERFAKRSEGGPWDAVMKESKSDRERLSKALRDAVKRGINRIEELEV